MRRLILLVSVLCLALQADVGIGAITITTDAWRGGMGTAVDLYRDNGTLFESSSTAGGGAIRITAATGSQSSLLGAPTYGFCIEIPENVYIPGTTSGYDLVNLQDAPVSNGTSGIGPMGAVGALRIQELWSLHYSEVTSGGDTSDATFNSLDQTKLGAFQLAIWKLSYDQAPVVGPLFTASDWTQGNLRVASDPYGERLLATTWLNEVLTLPATASDVMALSKIGSQDLSVLVGPLGSPTPVPEPLSWLIWSGLGVAVVVTARRRKLAAA